MLKQPSARNCFVCGRQNQNGLKVNFYNDLENQQVRAEVVVPEHFNGYPGFVHGGIVATLLDETSGRATLLDGDNDNLMVTARLDIKYILPTPTGQPLTIVGWKTKGSRRHAHVKGEIRLADGTVTARCEATVIRPPAGYHEMWNWDVEGKHWKVYED
ncbi:MAG: PaaI family thioesterase [Syntrophomonas sp.]